MDLSLLTMFFVGRLWPSYDDADDSDDNGDDCEDLEYWLELRPSDGGGAGQNPSGQAMSC